MTASLVRVSLLTVKPGLVSEQNLFCADLVVRNRLFQLNNLVTNSIQMVLYPNTVTYSGYGLYVVLVIYITNKF